jgi:hypothetical protein
MADIKQNPGSKEFQAAAARVRKLKAEPDPKDMAKVLSSICLASFLSIPQPLTLAVDLSWLTGY